MSVIPYSSFVQDFRIDKQIGKGSCATVFKVYSTPQKKHFAYKLIKSSDYEEISQARNQIEALTAIDDIQLTTLHYYCQRINSKTGNFELGLIMDLCDSTLAEAIETRRKKSGLFKAEDIRQFLRTTVPCLAKMQKRGYLHRDIKPDNILIKGKKGDYRLADFGFSLRQNQYSDRNIAGTKQYVSPKLLVKFQNQKISVKGHNIKDDVYSYGKTLLDMLTLQIGSSLTNTVFNTIKTNFGRDISNILSMMLEQSENNRADFIQIEQQLNLLGIMGALTKREDSNSSLKTKAKLGSLDSRSNADTAYGSRFNNTRQAKGKTSQQSRTKRKQYDSSVDSSQTTIQHRQKQAQPVKVQRGQEMCHQIQLMSKVVLPIKRQITCMTATEDIIFMGLQDQLGIIYKSKKQVRFPHSQNFKTIVCLAISPDQSTLLIGALNCKLYIVAINQIEKLIVDNLKSFQVNNVIEMSFGYLNCREIKCHSSVSTIYLPPDCPAVVLGHQSGEISVVRGMEVERKISFFTDPVTAIKHQGSTLFSSTAQGHFKRQPAFFMDFEEKSARQTPKFDRILNIFKCPTTIVDFELISDCQANKHIPAEKYQHMAVLACYNGLLYVLSKAMECEAVIRASYEPMLAVRLKPSPDSLEGYEGLFVGREGTLSNHKGRTVSHLGEKELSCLTTSGKTIVSGGYNKKVVMLLQQEAIEID